MKTLPVIATAAAFLVFALIPTPAAAGSLFFAVSLLTIFAADYSRVRRPITPRAPVLPFPGAYRSAQNCELAA
ncbi:MAG: hypothetical protein JSR48_11745 [Verrucomicrobia bacterium]|nr:hypothetical protein [Verrucomicrobiota bacterium]